MPKLWFRAETERNRILPPVCPSCLGVGVRPLEVPSLAGANPSSTTAYYCDRCADRIERASTLLVARLAAAALLGIGTATSAALVFGGSRVDLQVVLVLLSAVLPLGVAALGSPHAEGRALFSLPGSDSTHGWLAARKDYLAELGAEVTTPSPGPRPARMREAIPVVLALSWLAGLHWLGRAELRVIHGSHEEAVVLIDHRKRDVTPPTRVEHPHAARAVSTLAGRRSLALVGTGGDPLVELVATLWPGRDYLLGTLPEGQCLFLQQQEYGKQGEDHQLTPIATGGPLWELPSHVDVWFAGLSERPSLPTSGGVRTAIRLLPCR